MGLYEMWGVGTNGKHTTAAVVGFHKRRSPIFSVSFADDDGSPGPGNFRDISLVNVNLNGTTFREGAYM